MFVHTDTEPPVLICPTNQTLQTDSGQPTAIAFWTGPNATDNSRKNVNITCSTDSGSQREIGQTKVVCEACDLSGNHATCTFTVDIKGNSGRRFILRIFNCMPFSKFRYVSKTFWCIFDTEPTQSILLSYTSSKDHVI